MGVGVSKCLRTIVFFSICLLYGVVLPIGLTILIRR